MGASAGAVGGATQPGTETAAPAPQTVKKSVWGPTSLNGESLWPTYRDLGVGLFSIQARWDQIAPTEPAEPRDPLDPAYVWPEYLDFAVSEATEHGMKVQILIMGAPPWSNGGKGWKWSPRDPLDFADFATAISGRYPSVDHWMIWGEPNRKPNFGPFTPATSPTGKLNKDQQAAPRAYAKLLDLSYRALKADDPSNLVIGGNTYTASGRRATSTPTSGSAT